MLFLIYHSKIYFNKYFGEIHLTIQKSFALRLPASRIYAELHLTVTREHTLFDAVSIFSCLKNQFSAATINNLFQNLWNITSMNKLLVLHTASHLFKNLSIQQYYVGSKAKTYLIIEKIAWMSSSMKHTTALCKRVILVVIIPDVF